MSPHFRSYTANLNRVRIQELIDSHYFQIRRATVRPSLIVNPITGQSYAIASEGGSDPSSR